MKKVVLGVFFFLLCYHPAVSAKEKRLSDDKVGWLHGNCLAIKKADLLPHQALTIIPLDGDQSADTASIIKKAVTGEDCYPLADDRRDANTANGYDFYLVKSNQDIGLAIGLLSPRKKDEFLYSYCMTSEGIKYTVSSDNKKIWEGYYYLGYDVEPSCKEE